MQKIVSSMLSTLKKYKADEAVEKSWNRLALKTSVVDCDYYRFMQRLDPEAANSYSGTFMAQYSWAEFMTGYLDSFYYKY